MFLRCFTTQHDCRKVCVNLQHVFSDLRTATSEKTLPLVDRLLIYWNGVPTALYDPRPAVQQFMLSKDRRMNLPTVSTYVERDFIKKFFK
jgi:hypothetical protein